MKQILLQIISFWTKGIPACEEPGEALSSNK